MRFVTKKRTGEVGHCVLRLAGPMPFEANPFGIKKRSTKTHEITPNTSCHFVLFRGSYPAQNAVETRALLPQSYNGFSVSVFQEIVKEMNKAIRGPSGNSEGVGSDSQVSRVQTTRKVQLLRTGSLVFGVFEDEITTIEKWRQPTQLPQAPRAVLGVVAIQGRILTTLDPVALINANSENDNSELCQIVALRGDDQVALAFEDQGEVLELAIKDIQQPAQPDGGAVLGTFRNQGQFVYLLDIKALFPAAIKGHERRQRSL